MSSQKSLPNLFQTAAQYRVYTRLLSLSMTSMTSILLGPMLGKILGFLINLVTNDMCFFTIFLTSFLVMFAYLTAFRLSTSPKALDQWLEKSEGSVPFYSFLTSCVIARSVSTFLGIQGLWNPTKVLPTFGSSLRIAVAVFMLQGILTLRYISPVSIMRCSAMPLVMNPVETTTRNIVRRPSSIVEPSENPGELKFGFPQYSRGRRFLRPSFYNLLRHVFISLVTGVLVAFTAALHFIPPVYANMTEKETSMQQTLVATTCALAMLLTIPFPERHEIDSKLYRSLEDVLWNHISHVDICFRSVMVAAAVMLASTVFVNPFVHTIRATVTSLLSLAAVCGTILLVMSIMDAWLKFDLFTPFDIQRSLDGICSESSMVARIDSVVTGLMHDSSLAKEVRTIHLGKEMDLRQERIRCAEHSTLLSHILLSQNGPSLEAPFEEDLFRIAILEAMGGNRPLPANYWLAAQQGTGNEPVNLILVRALSVFVGGLGKSLLECTNEVNPTLHQNLSSASREEYWFVAPSFFTAAEYALNAVQRFVCHSFTAGGPIPDWKGYHMAVMVPAALQGIFHIHGGLSKFSLYQNQKLGCHSQSLAVEHLIKLCISAAVQILCCLQSPNPDDRNDLMLEEDCYLWTQSLINTSANRNASPQLRIT